MIMGLSTIKRLASDILGAGISRVHIRPDGIVRAKEALTRNDVRSLIKEGIVYKEPVKGRRKKTEKKRKRSGRRHGSSTQDQKKMWMRQVRSQRKYLVQLLSEGSLENEHKWIIYSKIKSGIFKSRNAMHAYLKEAKMLKDAKKPQPEALQSAPAATKAAKSPKESNSSKEAKLQEAKS